MKALSKDEIEKNARLCASHGDESDCQFNDGTEAHRIWMAAYGAQCRQDAENAQVSYEMHPDQYRHR